MNNQIDNKWIKGVDYPEWMTDKAINILKNGYLLKNETPREMYMRISNAVCSRIPEAIDELDTRLQNELDESNPNNDKTIDSFGLRIFKYLWNNWLCPATPVASNLGTNKGLPISCYILELQDSTDDIYDNVKQMALLTKYGGGVGTTWNKIRPSGSIISKGGTTNGIIPFIKVYETAIVATSQGNTRRGAASVNLNIEHGDWEDFIKMRKPEGDEFRVCRNIHHCTEINDDFMKSLTDKNHINHIKNKTKWFRLLQMRMETGESYVNYVDTCSNDIKTPWYNPKLINNDSELVNLRSYSGTNICSECMAFLKEDETFTCCLSSLNVARYDEWKGNKLFIQDCVYFLNGVLNEFIEKSKNIKGFEKAHNFAKRHRSIGLGQLGLHTYLQEHNLPFVSISHRMLANQLGKFIYDNAKLASQQLASIYGEPEVMKGTGQYNSQLIAIAPTKGNSEYSGGVSEGIGMIESNCFKQQGAKVSSVFKNPTLSKLLKSKYNISEDIDKELCDQLWNSILDNRGSIQHLNFIDNEDKEVFLTSKEISQIGVIELAAIRQQYIDQAQSLNLSLNSNITTKELSDIHYIAWKKGIKTLYYVRSNNDISADTITFDSDKLNKLNANKPNEISSQGTSSDSCVFCEG